MLFVMHIQLSHSREFFVTVIANKILNTKMLFEMSCIVTWFFITVRAILTQIEIVIMNTHMTVSWVSTRHKKYQSPIENSCETPNYPTKAVFENLTRMWVLGTCKRSFDEHSFYESFYE